MLKNKKIPQTQGTVEPHNLLIFLVYRIVDQGQRTALELNTDVELRKFKNRGISSLIIIVSVSCLFIRKGHKKREMQSKKIKKNPTPALLHLPTTFVRATEQQ